MSPPLAMALLAEVTRRDQRPGTEVVESRHHGHAVVVGPDGAVRAGLGDPGRITFARSAVKPFQATACLELLAGTEDDLSTEEIAVAWASHRGEPRHLEAVRRLLGRSGTAPDDLTCPPAVPEAAPGAAPARLQHNCSGKHALFALAGAAVGCPKDRILDPDGPLQTVVLAHLQEALGRPAAVAVDGCGAPAVAVPLERLAAGYRLLMGDGRYRRVREAGLAHPGLVGGQGRVESALLRNGVVAKVGAEGVYGAGWRDDEGTWGLAVKSEDGSPRGAGAWVFALLAALGIVPADAWAPDPVLGGGRPQGQVRGCVEEALTQLT